MNGLPGPKLYKHTSGCYCRGRGRWRVGWREREMKREREREREMWKREKGKKRG